MEIIQNNLRESQLRCDKTGLPLVTLSYAQSIDGSIAHHRGHNANISGKESLLVTHQLRAIHSSILVGIGTILSDNPRLNVRYVEGKDPQVIILDSSLRIPIDCKILREKNRPVWIFSGMNPGKKKDILESKGCNVIQVPQNRANELDLQIVLKKIAALGIHSVMVEGGAQVIKSFLMMGLVDQVVITIAPLWLGGLPSIERSSRDDTQDNPELFPSLENITYQQAGRDLILYGEIKKKGGLVL